MNKIQKIMTLVLERNVNLFLSLFLPIFLVTIFSFVKEDNQILIDERKAYNTEKTVDFVQLEETPEQVMEEVEPKIDGNKALKEDEKEEVERTEKGNNIISRTVVIVNDRQIDPTKPMVALTFDDGPNRVKTNRILDIMERYNAVATFFELGNLVEKNKDTVRREEQLKCEVGNHSYEHKNLDKLTVSQINEDIYKSEKAFFDALGHKPKLFRTPYGNANSKVLKNIEYPIIKWDVDTLDWKLRNREKIIEKFRNIENYDGRIILMHSLYDSTVDAVEVIVPELIDKGYQLVTVSELAYYKGYDILENGKVYCSFR